MEHRVFWCTVCNGRGDVGGDVHLICQACGGTGDFDFEEDQIAATDGDVPITVLAEQDSVEKWQECYGRESYDADHNHSMDH